MSKKLPTIDLRLCQGCRTSQPTTRRREGYRVLGFQGPCADSFCYASCDSALCRPITPSLCDTCAALSPLELKS